MTGYSTSATRAGQPITRTVRRGAHLLITTGLLALAAASPARAADAAADAAAEADSDAGTIVVTGTRAGARAIEESLVPISVASSEDLRRSGKQNLRDALAQALPSYQLQAGGYQGQQGAAVRGARLRGLDAKDTLILVDGVRRHTTSLLVGGASPTDLDLIPANAIDHIEVLGDGAASLYGSDAIAGVINIILKKTADTGGEFSVYYGQYGQTVGDLAEKYGRTKNAQFHQGFALAGGGFINVSVNAQLQNATNNFPAFAAPSLTDGTSTLYPLLANGSLDPRETSKSRYRQWMGQPSSEIYSFAYNAEAPISDNVTFYSNATYAWRYSSGPGYFRSASNQSTTLPSTNPSTQDPFANAPYTSGELLFPDGYLPTFDVKENDFQIVSGLKGKVAGWDWNLYSSIGQDYAKVYTKNSNSTSNGPDNWAQKDFYDGAQVGTQILTALAVLKKLDNGLFGRPLSIAAGLEHRFDRYTKKAGEFLSYNPGPWQWVKGGPNSEAHPNAGAQGMSGFTPASAGSWTRNNFAAYIELNQQLTDAWTVDLAGRFEHFSDFGDVPSGQISTRYEISRGFALRGTFGNGFSAPTLLQSRNSTQSGGFSRDTNPDSQTFGKIRESQTATTNAYQVIGQAIGVKALEPERSVNASVGFVAKPFSRTVLTIDAYLIDISNRITSATALVTPKTALYDAIALAAKVNNLTSVSFNINGAHTFTKGVDLRLERTESLGTFGTLRWTVTHNYNETKIKSFQPLPAIIVPASASTLRVLTGSLTSYYPKNITALALDWSYGKLNFRAKETHWSPVDYLGTSPAADQHQSAAFTTDASVSYDVSDNLNISVGGNNVFNRRPDRLSAATSKLTNAGWNTDVPQYNYYAPFGLDGGYYYARINVKW